MTLQSDYYATFQNIVNGKRVASLVAMTDESEQTKARRGIAHNYSLSTLVEYEPLVDSTTATFLTQLDERFADTGEVCDFGRWLQFFAFDVIGELAFSKRLGFLESGTDVDNIMQSIEKNFDYFSVIGQMPVLDLWLGKNPIYVRFFKRAVSSPILQFAQGLLRERIGPDKAKEVEDTRGTPVVADKHDDLHQRPDFLSRFLTLSAENPEPMTDKQILANLFANINAGSDTIASTLRAIFYYLLKNPDTLATLYAELDAALSSGHLTLPYITWNESQSFPYLGAVIKEGLRMHPALSLPLERIVPPSGLQIHNTFIPPGTVVGINPYVLQRDPRIFGTDAESWNPSRWLSEEEKHTKKMEHSLLTFGAGKRGCLGRNIATLELHKIVPSLLMRYRIELAYPEREWTVHNCWLLKQEGLLVRLGYREGTGEVELGLRG